MQDWAFSKQDGACSDCLNISSAPNGTDEGYGGTYIMLTDKKILTIMSIFETMHLGLHVQQERWCTTLHKVYHCFHAMNVTRSLG